MEQSGNQRTVPDSHLGLDRLGSQKTGRCLWIQPPDRALQVHGGLAECQYIEWGP